MKIGLVGLPANTGRSTACPRTALLPRSRPPPLLPTAMRLGELTSGPELPTLPRDELLPDVVLPPEDVGLLPRETALPLLSTTPTLDERCSLFDVRLAPTCGSAAEDSEGSGSTVG